MSSRKGSLIDMSLEDIIQKRKREMKAKTKNVPLNTKGKPQAPNKKTQPIADARLKIISKKRIQITDAREKLAELAKQKDARYKIEQMKHKRLGGQQLTQHNPKIVSRGKLLRSLPSKERVFIDPSRQVVSHPLRKFPRQVNSNRYIENNRLSRRQRHTENVLRPKPILRTVENDLEILDDPMDEEYESPKSYLLNRKASLQLKIVAHNNDTWKTNSGESSRIAVQGKETSPPRPPSILKKRPMAALRQEKSVEKSDKPVLEFRIIVSNLRNTVTAGDIEELFGDVGGMVESRLVRPGTAEVIYKSQEDAQRAVDLYHNRQLDGQPMNCLLVTPRANTAIPRSSAKPALYSTNSNVEPDISTFHKVLFSNL